MEAAVKRRGNHDVITAFHRLANAAEEFVNRAPRVKRIHAQRATLLDAIAHAQLVLSVHRLPTDTQKDVPRESDKRNAARLDEQVQTAQARTRELESRLRPLMTEVKKLHIHAEKVKASLEDVLHSSEGSLHTNEAA
jgi:predicted  nucleic acid-binding Zn-ribbon protein